MREEGEGECSKDWTHWAWPGVACPRLCCRCVAGVSWSAWSSTNQSGSGETKWKRNSSLISSNTFPTPWKSAERENIVLILWVSARKKNFKIFVHWVSILCLSLFNFKLIPAKCTHFDNWTGSHLFFILLCSIHTILSQKLSKDLLKIRKRLKRPYFFSGVLSRLDGFVDGGVGGRERFSARARVAFKSEQSGLSQLTIVCVTRVSGWLDFVRCNFHVQMSEEKKVQVMFSNFQNERFSIIFYAQW